MEASDPPRGAGAPDTVTCPMNLPYRLTLLSALPLGALALAAGLGGLLGLPLGARGEHPLELGLAVLAGAALILFGASALPHLRLRVTPREVEVFAAGLPCRTRRVPLDRVRRYGVGEEAHRGRHVPVLLLDDGERVHRARLSMFERWREAVATLEKRLGRPPARTERSWRGARFADDR